MKTSIRRDHAEFLQRQYMGMLLGRDIMLGLYNREAYSHKAMARQGRPSDQTNQGESRESGNDAPESLKR